MRSRIAAVVFMVALGLSVGLPAWAQAPDIVLINGRILASDAACSISEALAVPVVVTPPATLDAFLERRRLTQAELVAAAPDNPVVRAACLWVAGDDAPRAQGARYHR